MKEISQGDIVKLSGFRSCFLVVSKNAFIRSTGMFHVCPVFPKLSPGPVHIRIRFLISGEDAVACCEQVKLIDPKERSIGVIDRISYADKMEVSDTIQGIFEYD